MYYSKVNWIKFNGKQQMRAIKYEDGVARINAKIVIPMSDSDVSDYVISAVNSNLASVNEVQTLNKRELLQLAKMEISSLGVKEPKNRVEQVDNDTQVIIRNYVKRMFPELG
jgi:hypothetical protein